MMNGPNAMLLHEAAEVHRRNHGNEEVGGLLVDLLETIACGFGVGIAEVWEAALPLASAILAEETNRRVTEDLVRDLDAQAESGGRDPEWRERDIIMDADGLAFQRHEDRWYYGYRGSVNPEPPLILLVRDGKPVTR